MIAALSEQAKAVAPIIQKPKRMKKPVLYPGLMHSFSFSSSVLLFMIRWRKFNPDGILASESAFCVKLNDPPAKNSF